MLDEINVICRDTEFKLAALVQDQVTKFDELKSKYDDAIFQLDALRQHLQKRETEHSEAYKSLHQLHTRLTHENDKVVVENVHLKQLNERLGDSITQLQKKGIAVIGVDARMPLQEQSPNEITPTRKSPSSQVHKLEKELKAQQQRYQNLKSYNEELATKYRRERNIWKQWTENQSREELRASRERSNSCMGRKSEYRSTVPSAPKIKREAEEPVSLPENKSPKHGVDIRLKRSRSSSATTEDLADTVRLPQKLENQPSPAISGNIGLESAQPHEQPYHEVVRGRDARRRLHANDCPCCSRFYELAGPSVAQQGPTWRAASNADLTKTAQDIRQEVGRHRARFRRSPTPPLFWNCDFPTTQELQAERQHNDQKRRRRSGNTVTGTVKS